MLSHKALPVRTIMFGKMHMMVNSAIGQNVKSGAAYFDLIVNVLSLGLWACACIDRYCKEQRTSLFQRRGTGIFQSYAQSPTSLNVGAIEIGYRGMKNPTDPIGEFARREGRPGVVNGLGRADSSRNFDRTFNRRDLRIIQWRINFLCRIATLHRDSWWLIFISCVILNLYGR